MCILCQEIALSIKLLYATSAQRIYVEVDEYWPPGVKYDVL